MITFRARGSHIRPAASTSLLALVPLLLALGLVTAGCSNPRASHAPPLDAYALSGGKITRFISEPGLSADPTARAMLLACRQLPVTSSIAQSATLVVTTGQFGRVPLHALVVGKQVLMLPSDFATMGITFSANSHEFILYPTSPERIVFVDGTKKAYVGLKQIALQMPIVEEDNQLIMLLSDLQRIFKERDRQRHQPPFIRDVKIIYNIRDYHR